MERCHGIRLQDLAVRVSRFVPARYVPVVNVPDVSPHTHCEEECTQRDVTATEGTQSLLRDNVRIQRRRCSVRTN